MTPEQRDEIRKAARYLEHLLTEAGEDFELDSKRHAYWLLEREGMQYIYQLSIIHKQETRVA